MQLIDSHIHLNSPLYSNLPQLLKHARSKGITHWIIPGTMLSDIHAQIILKERYIGIENAFGIHPWKIADTDISITSKEWQIILADALIQHRAIAIGECGLDFATDALIEQRKVQLMVFEAQVELAESLALPLIIHSYKAIDQVLKILRRYPSVCGVFHGFNGSLQQLEQIIDLGYYIGVGGAITYYRAKRMQRNLLQIPPSRLLLETDGPYQAGAYRMKEEIHYPEDLLQIAQSIAQQRSLMLEDLAKITTDNVVQLFNLEL